MCAKGTTSKPSSQSAQATAAQCAFRPVIESVYAYTTPRLGLLALGRGTTGCNPVQKLVLVGMGPEREQISLPLLSIHATDELADLFAAARVLTRI